jgi:hypothetical protein
VSETLLDILELISSDINSKAILAEIDLFKLVFLSFPLLKDSTDRVLNSLLFKNQNNLNYLKRVVQDLGTILELRDSKGYSQSIRLLRENKSLWQLSKTEIPGVVSEHSMFLVEANERNKNLVYFEELVEQFVCSTIKVNIDNVKMLAVFFLEKICQIFMVVEVLLKSEFRKLLCRNEAPHGVRPVFNLIGWIGEHQERRDHGSYQRELQLPEQARLLLEERIQFQVRPLRAA